MSVKHAILTLLYHKSRHGYEIKIGFEHMMHKQWPLNAGQIYTTLDRLVRDGLVEPGGEDDLERKQYVITATGIEELRRWLLDPVERSLLKDELFFKYLCACKIHFSEVSGLLGRQRSAIMQTILQLTRLKSNLDPVQDREMALLIEGGLLHLEADLKWMDLLEQE